MPAARGEAKVESKQGYIEVEVEFDNLQPATRFGPEFLTYVLWAITPEGRATNMGEIILDGTKSKLDVTTELQAFGMVVTAEPYFAVSQPSDAVVMENVVRQDTKAKSRRSTRNTNSCNAANTRSTCCRRTSSRCSWTRRPHSTFTRLEMRCESRNGPALMCPPPTASIRRASFSLRPKPTRRETRDRGR